MSNAENQSNAPGNQELELELTYLASRLPSEINGVEPSRIVDIYIPETSDHSRLRLRQNGDQYEITKKVPVEGGDASMHIETTVALDKNEFEALSVASNKRVIKDRYKVDIEGHEAEVDVFRGALEGLVVIDFEFSSRAEQLAFSKPKVCLVDITQEDFIAGGLLAGRTYRDIQPELDRFNYKAI